LVGSGTNRCGRTLCSDDNTRVWVARVSSTRGVHWYGNRGLNTTTRSSRNTFSADTLIGRIAKVCRLRCVDTLSSTRLRLNGSYTCVIITSVMVITISIGCAKRLGSAHACIGTLNAGGIVTRICGTCSRVWDGKRSMVARSSTSITSRRIAMSSWARNGRGLTKS
jgi:hypothetical protein